MKFDNINLLENATIREGDRWAYVADFNVDHDGNNIPSPGRIDVELDDIRQIVDAGGVVAALAHKGRFKDGDTEDLDFAVEYVGRKIGCNALYFPENNTQDAVDFLNALPPGTFAGMGNARMHEGEEKNDPILAEQFARLGDRVAVGGFGKAHRAHASNVGILKHIPGYLTRSQTREMETLEEWAGRSEAFSVAVLGGVKKEKITTGLVGFAENYDAIIPGGIVLNNILLAKGYDVGESLIADGAKPLLPTVEELLHGEYGSKIYVPNQVVVATYSDGNFSEGTVIDIADGVPSGYMIVDYILSDDALGCLEKAERGIVAGTPGIYNKGFTSATDAVMESMRKDDVRAIILGGDTAAELEFDGPVSTGGGSALYFASYRTTPVMDALRGA